MNEEKVKSKRDLIAPIVSILAFLFLLGGASYAYYTIGSQATGGNVAGNVQLPARCIASVTTNSTCNTSLTVAQMNPSNKSVAANNQSSTTCGFTITVNGNQGCACTYNTQLKSTNVSAFGSSYYVANSISYAITGDRQVAETNIPVGWTENSAVLAQKTLTVAQTGTAVQENLNLVLKMYNRDADQDKMSGKAYVLYLYANPSCSIPTS